MNYQDVLFLDKHDPLAAKRQEFSLPADCIYLDGNSLGALPLAAHKRASEVVSEQWGNDLIQSWNKHQWIDLPRQVGEKIAPLVGAAPGQVICCDSISVNLFKLLCSALHMQPDRKLVVSQADNFPTDLYMVQGVSELLSSERCTLQMVSEDTIENALNDQVAVLLLSQVNFRSGKLLDMQKITQKAHKKGILVIWDLAHSAGAFQVELDQCQVDFAVGCGYKYLNGGPGAPAFLYVAKRHQQFVQQPLSGWMGHKAPFKFDAQYIASEGVQQYLCGTPPILSMSVLDAALGVYEKLDMDLLRKKSVGLSELFMQSVDQYEVLSDLHLHSPLQAEHRGSQLAYQHPAAYAICQNLIARGVIGDFRAPDILRFGFTPLYLRYEDIWQAVKILAEIIGDKTYLDEKYTTEQKVT
jgi:kynureninase